MEPVLGNMEDAFNKTLTSLLFAPGAQNWYEDEINVPFVPFPKKEKITYPLYPNKKPILPSGEIANLNPPLEVPSQNGTYQDDEDIEADSESSEEEEMDYEEKITCSSEQKVIRLDSCGREVEDFQGIMQFTSDEDETVEEQLPFERSSAQFQPPVDEDVKEPVRQKARIQPSSSITKKSQRIKAMINQQKRRQRNLSPITSTSDDGRIRPQYRPINGTASGSEYLTPSKGRAKTRFVTTDIKIDQFNGILKYTFIKEPVIVKPEESSDDDERTQRKGSK
ncbi:hypothetical protein JTE90_012515 [Oedothorax gibbosus]|uniref:Uncharacterized protein n=1 Tax=Oedothorax gibbosus TaxID=931172 RepID=A0AAV6V046_9ARAC|nr:hypothetical protein JTE90_012515 [Oedothorax gibbosus]